MKSYQKEFLKKNSWKIKRQKNADLKFRKQAIGAQDHIWKERIWKNKEKWHQKESNQKKTCWNGPKKKSQDRNVKNQAIMKTNRSGTPNP